MDKELFKELEANLIQALELVRSAQTSQAQCRVDHTPWCIECGAKSKEECECNRPEPKGISADTKQDSSQEQINDDKVLSRSFVVRSRQSVDPDELDEQRQDSTHYPGCMYFRWNWKYSWHESDCTCDEQGLKT